MTDESQTPENGPQPKRSEYRKPRKPRLAQPPQHYIDQAMLGVAKVLSGCPSGFGEKLSTLRKRLEQSGCIPTAIAWAIYLHHMGGRVRIRFQNPEEEYFEYCESGRGDNVYGHAESHLRPEYIEPTEALTEWWLENETKTHRNDQDEDKPIMTEPMTKQELAKWFRFGRNDVTACILDKYHHEQVGHKYRMRVSDMPPGYLAKYGLKK